MHYLSLNSYKWCKKQWNGLLIATKLGPTFNKPYKRRRLHSTPQQEQTSSIALNRIVAEAIQADVLSEADYYLDTRVVYNFMRDISRERKKKKELRYISSVMAKKLNIPRRLAVGFAIEFYNALRTRNYAINDDVYLLGDIVPGSNTLDDFGKERFPVKYWVSSNRTVQVVKASSAKYICKRTWVSNFRKISYYSAWQLAWLG